MNSRNVIVAAMAGVAVAAMIAAVIMAIVHDSIAMTVLLGFASTLLVSLGGLFMAANANDNARTAVDKTNETNTKLDVIHDKVNGHMAALIEKAGS